MYSSTSTMSRSEVQLSPLPDYCCTHSASMASRLMILHVALRRLRGSYHLVHTPIGKTASQPMREFYIIYLQGKNLSKNKTLHLHARTIARLSQQGLVWCDDCCFHWNLAHRTSIAEGYARILFVRFCWFIQWGYVSQYLRGGSGNPFAVAMSVVFPAPALSRYIYLT